MANFRLISPQARRRADRQLTIMQFLFLLTWIVYAIYLEKLLQGMGYAREFALMLLILDQVLFAVADIALGCWADRLIKQWKKLAPWLITLNLLGCLSFMALPFLAMNGQSTFFMVMTVCWVLSASALRTPLYTLIATRANDHKSSASHAWALLGMGLASASAPYLGQSLTNVSPVLPFVLSGASLALVSFGFLHKGFLPEPPSKTASEKVLTPRSSALFKLLPIGFCLGLAVQVHLFINSGRLYKGFVPATELPWVLPVFWIGFSTLLFPASKWLNQLSPTRLILAGGVLGTLSLVLCTVAPNLPTLLIGQLLMGGAWGLVFMGGLCAAGGWGQRGREGLFLGAWFAMLAIGTGIRIAMILSGYAQSFNLTLWLANGLWLVGVVLAAWGFKNSLRESAATQ
jgi:hypothetical protein